LRLHRTELDRGFLLARSRLIVYPIGLDFVVRKLLGQGIADSKSALELGKQIVQALATTIQQESRGTNLAMALDGPTWPASTARAAESVAGLTWAEAEEVGPKELSAAGALHDIAGSGTVVLPRGLPPTALTQLLSHAWKKTGIGRICLGDAAS
jgi:hypothetical protein